MLQSVVRKAFLIALHRWVALYENVGPLKEKYEAYDEKIGEHTGPLRGMLVNISSLSGEIDELVARYSALDSGINEYTDGVAQLVAGDTLIIDGISSLATGSNKLTDSARELYNGLVSDCDGMFELTAGTNELHTQTAGMDTQVQDKMDEILTSIGGKETETVSFVSEIVQFVMKTGSIENSETVIHGAPKKAPLNFWQKLLRPFGLYGWNLSFRQKQDTGGSPYPAIRLGYSWKWRKEWPE